MKVKDSNYADYKTARQWAKKGYLPVSGATGVELWANAYCQDSYTYYAPNEVAAAAPEQIKEFFAPEREQRNKKAKEQRQQRKEQKQKAEEQRKKQEQQYLIEQAVAPYLQQIAELRRIIWQISKSNQSHGGNGCFVIDTETTGLDAIENELLQVSIIKDSGEIMFDSYFKPFATAWTEAQAVNGISPDMVKDAPRISEKIAEINGILAGAGTIIGYNTSFDLYFLSNNGLIIPEDAEIIDVMQEFAPVFGE